MKYGKLLMSKIVNESYNDSQCANANIGDALQSVAIKYLYSLCSIKESDIIEIGIDELKEYQGEEMLLPLIGVFDRQSIIYRFPCSEKIIPVFVSCLLYDDVLCNNKALVEWLKRYEPIGCRDERTCEIFRAYGINAYMMGCISMIFSMRDKESDKYKEVYAIDIPRALVKEINRRFSNVKYLEHEVPLEEYPISNNECHRLEEYAEKRIDLYKKTSKLVITSRLHAAAPCIAMGIPTIVVCNNIDYRFAWLDKYVPIYSKSEFAEIDYDIKNINTTYIKGKIIEIWRSAIKQNIPELEKILQETDVFYQDRNRSNYFMEFRKIILESGIHNGSKYAIWGAGQHCDYVMMLIKEMYPKANLVGVVDKYKYGGHLNNGIEIVGLDAVDKINAELFFITTFPGKEEAAELLSRRGMKKNKDYFLIMAKEERVLGEEVD